LSGLDADIPDLTRAGRDGLLRRIGVTAPRVDANGLTALVRGWLLSIPFHNLDLLAASLNGRGSLSAAEALGRCEAGLGGPCHVHAVGFAALLTACGFDVGLCSATIGHEGDHLLVRVAIRGETYLCDVGNGQPYLAPFRTGRVTEVTHLGWRVRAEPHGDGIRLMRWSPDLPAGKVVYHATAAPRKWADFAEVIALHHSQPGFGPFMTSLRAVRMGEERMDTLRGDQWTRYDPDGFTVRGVPGDSIAALLVNVFGLEGLPIAAALRACQAAVGEGER